MVARTTSTALIVKNTAGALEFCAERVSSEKKMDYANGGYRCVTVGPKEQVWKWPYGRGVCRPDRLVQPIEGRGLSPDGDSLG